LHHDELRRDAGPADRARLCDRRDALDAHQVPQERRDARAQPRDPTALSYAKVISGPDELHGARAEDHRTGGVGVHAHIVVLAGLHVCGVREEDRPRWLDTETLIELVADHAWHGRPRDEARACHEGVRGARGGDRKISVGGIADVLDPDEGRLGHRIVAERAPPRRGRIAEVRDRRRRERERVAWVVFPGNDLAIRAPRDRARLQAHRPVVRIGALEGEVAAVVARGDHRRSHLPGHVLLVAGEYHAEAASPDLVLLGV
jgi:hypothetical protein